MTNTQHTIEKIVDEIIALAPELQEKREEVMKLVKKLIETKPNVVVDEAFVEDLRSRLQSTIRANEAKKSLSEESKLHTMKNLFTSKYLVGVAVLLLAIVVISPALDMSSSGVNQKLSLAPQISDVKSQAFGDLSGGELTDVDVTRVDQESAMSQMMAADTDDGSTAPGMESSMMRIAPQPGLGGGISDGEQAASTKIGAADSMIWMPQQVQYIFDGAIPEIKAEGSVYRRAFNGNGKAMTGAFADAFNVDLVDLDSFRGLGVRHITLHSDTGPGYTISLNFEDGSIGINRDWNNDDMYAGRDNAPTSVDAQEMIRIASAFLDKHGIDVSSYGEPEVVLNNYTIMPAMLETDTLVSHPEGSWPIYSVMVRYPLEIDGRRVVGQGGESMGVSVNINTMQNAVESVWGLEAQNYDRSSYPLLQNSEKIKELVANGGYMNRYYGYPEGQQGEVVDVTVSEPEIVLMQYWKHDNNTREQYLIPALRFDIDQARWQKEGVYVADAIVIPLVEDIIANTHDTPVPVPMERIPTEPTIGDGAGELTGPPSESEIFEIVE